jgi:hypothetical protein
MSKTFSKIYRDCKIEFGRPFGEVNGDGYRCFNSKGQCIGAGGTGKQNYQGKRYFQFWRSQATATVDNYLNKNENNQ